MLLDACLHATRGKHVGSRSLVIVKYLLSSLHCYFCKHVYTITSGSDTWIPMMTDDEFEVCFELMLSVVLAKRRM
jgi:hypothetical protein